jgi:predicted mannosyl-3-phosphoglycerate phosphatase (HAD superfamily)
VAEEMRPSMGAITEEVFMITFLNEELKKKVKEILEYFDSISVEYEFTDFDDIDDPEIEEEEVIDFNSTIEVGLPEGEEYEELTLKQLIEELIC